MSERKTGPVMKAYRCKDRSAYQYGKMCTAAMKETNGDLCQTGADQLCHISYKVTDFKKGRSDAAVCRTVPQDYIDGEYEFMPFGTVDSDKGLCAYGCEEFDNDNKCAWSWPAGEPKFLNAKGMFRCVPQDQ